MKIFRAFRTYLIQEIDLACQLCMPKPLVSLIEEYLYNDVPQKLSKEKDPPLARILPYQKALIQQLFMDNAQWTGEMPLKEDSLPLFSDGFSWLMIPKEFQQDFIDFWNMLMEWLNHFNEHELHENTINNCMTAIGFLAPSSELSSFTEPNFRVIDERYSDQGGCRLKLYTPRRWTKRPFDSSDFTTISSNHFFIQTLGRGWEEKEILGTVDLKKVVYHIDREEKNPQDWKTYQRGWVISHTVPSPSWTDIEEDRHFNIFTLDLYGEHIVKLPVADYEELNFARDVDRLSKAPKQQQGYLKRVFEQVNALSSFPLAKKLKKS